MSNSYEPNEPPFSCINPEWFSISHHSSSTIDSLIIEKPRQVTSSITDPQPILHCPYITTVKMFVKIAHATLAITAAFSGLAGPVTASPVDLGTTRNSSLVTLESHSISAAAYNGRFTHYAPGLGACGQSHSSGDMVVALSRTLTLPCLPCLNTARIQFPLSSKPSPPRPPKPWRGGN